MSKYTGLTQAQYEANNRYVSKTYKKVMFYLRIDDDKDILDSLEVAKDYGVNKREWLRELFDLANK